MDILVTGCAGFIGFHLTKRLLAGGHNVVGVDNLNDYYNPRLKTDRLSRLGINTDIVKGNAVNDKGNFRFIRQGVEETALYTEHLDNMRFDAICHLAAQAGVRYSIENPQQYISSNIQGFFNVLEYCRRNPSSKLVYASSSSVYGDSEDIPYKESNRTDSPVSFYAATKKSNEIMAYSYCSLYGIEAIGLRFFTVYGPWGRPDMAPFLFTKAIIEGSPIKVFNNGDMSRDFTYVDDIVEGVCKVLLSDPETPSPEKHRIYNIGNSAPVNLGKFIAEVERAAGKTARKIMMPMQPGDVKTTYADTSRLKEDYGYAPSTSIEEGMREFAGWYKDYYDIK